MNVQRPRRAAGQPAPAPRHASRAATPDDTGARTVDWLTVGQAAKYLGVSESTLRKWSDEGRVPAFSTPGGHRRFRTADLDAFLESSRVGSEQAAAVILIVAREERLRAGVRFALEADGFVVREAATGAEALAQLDEASPDAILLDVTMPELDGVDVLCALHERHGLAAVPVVVFGRGDPSRPGGVSTLSAHVDPLQLVEAVRETVG